MTKGICYNKTMENDKKKFYIKIFVIFLEVISGAVLLYLLLLPLYPVLLYKFKISEQAVQVPLEDIEAIRTSTRQAINSLPDSEYTVSKNRLIIHKIGVNAPIVESRSEEYGLSKGAWRVPESSTPDKGGNTVITGHRFKYLPPNNLTFYLFHELEVGDPVSVLWLGEEYYYKITETKVVPATAVSIMDPSNEPKITLFTCDPIYSTKNRLVVIAEPI
jgi:LPXTG-site transpeptidase (sortase) family protein